MQNASPILFIVEGLIYICEFIQFEHNGIVHPYKNDYKFSQHPSQKLSPTASIVEGYNIEPIVKVHKQKLCNMCITQKNLICKEKSDFKSPASYLYKWEKEVRNELIP